MEKVSLAALVLAPLGLILVWLNFDYFGPFMEEQLGIAGEVTITPEALILAAIISFLRLAIGLYGIARLRRSFREGAAGRPFSAESIAAFRRFALATLLYVIAGPIELTLLVLVLSLGNPPGQRIFAISISSSFVSALFVSVLILAIAQMLYKGLRLGQEPDFF